MSVLDRFPSRRAKTRLRHDDGEGLGGVNREASPVRVPPPPTPPHEGEGSALSTYKFWLSHLWA